MGIIKDILELIGSLIYGLSLCISFVGYFILGLIVIGGPVTIFFLIFFPFLGSLAVIPGFLV